MAVVTTEHPPAQVMSPRARRALMDALDRLEEDAGVAAVVIGDGAAGYPGQINPREIDVGLASPTPAELALRIEGFYKPVVTLLSGEVFGAGAELALAAHGRVAVETAQIGFRDINIGLPPSAGATQRLPRLVGGKAAPALLLTGRAFPVSSEAARDLFDVIAPQAEARAAAVALAERLAETGWTRTCDRTDGFSDGAGFQAEIARRKAAVHGERRLAAGIINALEAAQLFPFEAGLALEAEIFSELSNTDRSRGLRHALIAETRVCAGINAPPVNEVAMPVIGPGAARICAELVRHGITVRLHLPDRTTRERFEGAVRQNVEAQLHISELRGGAADTAMARVVAAEALAELSRCEVVMDVSADDADHKRPALAALAAVAGQEAPILSMTKRLDTAGLAPPEISGRVIGCHLPARSFDARLAELAVTGATDRAAHATARRLMLQIGRLPVRVAPVDGLAGPAMAEAFIEAADALVRCGVDPQAVDEAALRRGMARGPYQMLSEIDADGFADRLDREGHTHGLSSLVVRAGLRPGAGRDAAEEAAALDDLVREARTGTAQSGEPWTPAEIWTALLSAMINRGARLLAEEVVARPLALDVVMLQGYGFPRHLGGPMMAADRIGLFRVIQSMKALALLDSGLWTPHPKLVDMQRNGTDFADLDG
ncbi:MAG: enoyl-CoA hydratase-related protein [Pseudooceanicola sp.]